MVSNLKQRTTSNEGMLEKLFSLGKSTPIVYSISKWSALKYVHKNSIIHTDML